MKSVSAIFTVVMMFVFTTSSTAQINWVKHEASPLVTEGSPGSWNDNSLFPACVIFDGDLYHMWYGGHDGTTARIGYASSTDGITWSEYENNPVLDVGEAGSWEDDRVTSPNVLLDGGTFHMWYDGYDGTNTCIGYATSSDGINWTKYEGNPIMENGSGGSWTSVGIGGSNVLLQDTTFHMWYDGWDASDVIRVGYATSSDGITWNHFDDNPVLSPDAGAWDRQRVESAHVFFDGLVYHMWYTGGASPLWWRWRIGYASSPDGIIWTKYVGNPILSPTNGSWDSQYVGYARVLWDATVSKFKMWYGGGNGDWDSGMGYATASSMITVPGQFETIQAAIDVAVDGDVVLVDEGSYYENINFKGKAITVASQFYMDGDTSHISNTIIDGSQPSNPDSGSVVYLISGEDTTSVLMGFTITNGSGTKGQYTYEGVKYDSRDGGGIACWNSGGRFVSNKIINNTITDDTEAFGGGVAAGDFGSNAWVILEKNHIINNTVNGLNGGFGGGVGLTCNGKLIDNIISYNSCYATEDWTVGGGVYLGTESSEPRTVFIEENHINNNFIQGKGTQPTYYWSALGGGIYNDHCKILVLENEICNNKLTDLGTGNGSGGAIYTWLAGEGSVISRNTISNNLNGVTGTKYGGGISLASNDVPVLNNIITGNSSSHGGGIYCTYDDPEIINNTIVNNTASSFGGGLFASNSNPVVFNTILWGNEAQNGPQIYGSGYVRYSDIQGGWSGEGNIDLDPAFADTLYNLSDTSPCVGNGIDSVRVGSRWYICPSTDYYSQPRPYLPADEFVDMGAIESHFGQVSLSISTEDIATLTRFELQQNYPNPFNPKTIINYELPIAIEVELSIYNLIGQKVVTLVSENQKAGYHQVEWDASGFASGIYYYKITAGEYQDVKKMVLLR